MVRRAVLALVLVGAALVLLPTAASAHAVLEATNPADGAVLDAAPDEVVLQFNEVVAVRDGATTVLGPSGEPIAIGEVRAVDTTVRIPLPTDLDLGSYVVSWRVISADSHPVAGASTFAVGAPSFGVDLADVTGGSSPGSSIAEGVVTFAAYLGTLVAAGLVVFAAFVHDGGQDRRPLLRLATVAAGLGAAGVALALPVHVIELVDDGLAGLGQADAWREVAGGPVGQAAAVTVVGLVTLVAAGRALHRSAGLDAIVGAAAVVALGGFTLSGHTRTFGPWWLVVSSDLVHLVAGAVWLGGLIGLAVVLRRRSLVGPATAGSATILARFSTLAAASLVGVAAFGAALAWRVLGSWTALLDTTYGRVLLVKVGLVAVVAALGAYNRFRLVPRAEDATRTPLRLGRVVQVEAALLVLVVAVTGVLVDRSPTSEPAVLATSAAGGATPVPSGAEATDAVLEVDLGEIQATVTVSPATVGANRVVVDLHDAAGGPVVALDPPVLDLTLAEPQIGPIERTTVAGASPGTYEAEVELPAPGRWELRLSVRTSAYARPIGVAELDVEEAR